MSITHWQITPAVPYEALCFVNTLTGDPFYTHYYQAEYAHWVAQMPVAVQRALATIKRRMKEEAGLIISARLCLMFSHLPALTMSTLVETTTHPDALHQEYQHSLHYRETDWMLFTELSDELRLVLSFLQMRDFTGYWEREIGPQIAPAIEEFQATLPSYDILSEVEQQVGTRFRSAEISVYPTYFTKPHGISLAGTSFITSPAWPIATTVRTAIHEMMHPPYNPHNQEVQRLIATLRQDVFLMDRFTGHNPSFGYNTLEGLIEEGCVQALDQLISEQFDIAREPHARWQQSDEGLHVFAVALYALMQEEGYARHNRHGTFQAYLIDALPTTLRPGQIERIYDEFYQRQP